MTSAQAYGGVRHCIDCARQEKTVTDRAEWVTKALGWLDLARLLRREEALERELRAQKDNARSQEAA